MSEQQPTGVYVYQPFGDIQHPTRASSGRLYGVGGLPIEARCDGLTKAEAESIVVALRGDVRFASCQFGTEQGWRIFIPSDVTIEIQYARSRFIQLRPHPESSYGAGQHGDIIDVLRKTIEDLTAECNQYRAQISGLKVDLEHQIARQPPKRNDDTVVEYGERSLARIAGNIAAGLVSPDYFTNNLAISKIALASIAIAREILRQIREQNKAENSPGTTADAPAVRHGRTCEKWEHIVNVGYSHSADDDTPYDVDGVRYCGRCHERLPEAEGFAR